MSASSCRPGSAAGRCRYCGACDIDVDRARGDAACTQCGAVVESTLIVSEVQFEESVGGGARPVGQLVTGSAGGRIQGFRFGGSRAARELTVARVRTTLRVIADQLQLNDDTVESAMRLYEMALIRNFTVGRRRSHVLAACIYITCRLKESSLMLLDVSDVVQVNVYELGRTYTKLAQELFINVPVLDPCIYITRYAQKLELAESDIHRVSLAAMRLVQRMKRDWMAVGRRPSGLCGAALLVAARMNGYNRSVQDIVGVVNMSTSTIRKRLTEFAETPSGRLNLNEFETVDLEEEQDPPIFKAGQARAKERDNLVNAEIVRQLRKYQEVIECQLEDRQTQVCKRFARYIEVPSEFHPGVALSKEEEELLSGDFILENTLKTIEAIADINMSGSAAVVAQKVFDGTGCCLSANCTPSGKSKTFTSGNNFDLGFVNASSLSFDGNKQRAIGTASKFEPRAPDYVIVEANDGTLDLDGIDDEELDNYILTKEESALKAKMWITENISYLKSERAKVIQRAKTAVTQCEQRKKPKKMKKNFFQPGLPGENFRKILHEKKISKKINYDVLKNIDALIAGSGLSNAFDPAVSKQDEAVETKSYEKSDKFEQSDAARSEENGASISCCSSSFRTTPLKKSSKLKSRRPAPSAEDLRQVSTIALSLKLELAKARIREPDDEDECNTFDCHAPPSRSVSLVNKLESSEIAEEEAENKQCEVEETEEARKHDASETHEFDDAHGNEDNPPYSVNTRHATAAEMPEDEPVPSASKLLCLLREANDEYAGVQEAIDLCEEEEYY